MVTISDKPPAGARRRRRQRRRSRRTSARYASAAGAGACVDRAGRRGAAGRRSRCRLRRRRRRLRRPPRPTAATTTTGDDAGAAHRTAQPPVGDGDGGVALEQIGEFDAARLRHPAAVGRRRHLYVVEQCGRIQRVPLGGGEPERVPRHLRPGHLRRRAGPALGRLRTRLRALGALYVDYTDIDGDSRTSSTGARRRPAVADPDSARELLRDRGLRPQPQRRPAAVRARRRALPRHRRRRRRRRPGAHGAGPATARSASSCGSTRDEPAATLRAAPRIRPAQPVALLVRPRDRRPLDRRRRPGRLRGDRRRVARRPRPGPQLRLVGVRGHRALQRRPGGAGRDAAGARVRPRPRLLGDRRLRRPRPEPRARSTAATSTATSARASCAASPPTRTSDGARRPRRSGSRSRL